VTSTIPYEIALLPINVAQVTRPAGIGRPEGLHYIYPHPNPLPSREREKGRDFVGVGEASASHFLKGQVDGLYC